MNIQAFMTLLLSIVCSCMQAQVFDANVVLDFEHVSNNKAIIKNDSTLKVAPDERYLVSKLKYYISQICFKGEKVFIDPTPYLIEDGRNQQIRLTIPSGRYERLAFMLGLDSLLHCSGAQSGDLDPLNDMFWTWNNGYVIFKLEGKYFSSEGRSGKLEHHLGGYREDQKISQAIELKFPEPVVSVEPAVFEVPVPAVEPVSGEAPTVDESVSFFVSLLSDVLNVSGSITINEVPASIVSISLAVKFSNHLFADCASMFEYK